MNTAAPPSVLLYSPQTKTHIPGQRSPYSDLATGWTEMKSWFDSRQGQNILLFSKMIIQGLGAHTASYSMGNGGYFSWRQRVYDVKLTTSPTPSIDVKNEWNYNSTSPHIFMASKGKVFTLQTLCNTWNLFLIYPSKS